MIKKKKINHDAKSYSPTVNQGMGHGAACVLCGTPAWGPLRDVSRTSVRNASSQNLKWVEF